jgi:type I restriction enzyme S subunit
VSISTNQQTTISSSETGEWPLVFLGDVVSEAKSGFAIGERSDNGVIQVRMNNVDTRGSLIWDSFIRVPADSTTVDEFRLSKEDVLFNNTNSTALVGKSAYFSDHVEAVVFSNHFTRLRTNRKKLEPAYLAWWLNHQWQQGTFAAICNRWIGQSAVKADKLLALKIPLPSLTEQKRIAAKLTAALAFVDKARRAAEERRAAAEALPAAYLREVFRAVSETAPVRELADISEIASGITLGKRPHAANSREVPYMRVANVQDGYLLLDDVNTIRATEEEIDTLRLRRGDLILTEGGDRDKLGRGTWWNEELPECIHQNHIFRVRFPDGGVDHEFISFQLRSDYGKDYFLAHAKQTTGIATINRRVLGAFPVLMPESDVQRKIVHELSARLEAAHALIARCREELAAIESLPAALLRRAFQGALP